MDKSQDGFVRGIRTCVWMLKTMTDLDDHAVESHCRSLRPQDNAVLRTMRLVMARGDPHELDGLCAALTEMAIDADQSGDYTRNLANYADRREKIMRRWEGRRASTG